MATGQRNFFQVWLYLPECRLIGESDGYFNYLKNLSLQAKLVGPMIHDARIAAICQFNGVKELWSIDRDFSRFPEIKVINPL
jgi:predicted nucleic acid-binding protein